MQSNTLAGLISILSPCLLLACSSAQVSLSNPPSGGGNAGTLGTQGGGGGGISLSTAQSTQPDDTANKPAPPGCGDGNLTKDEACDDGNKVSGDGCAANCLRVEPGYSCVPAGQLCHPVARCGDGVLVTPEQCDDGNTVAGDGCSPTCKVELGYKCSSSTTNGKSACTHTTCGDRKLEGAEGCDDGNSMPFDGCSSDCQNEPNCIGTSCTSRCGDGIVLGEECDDGNNTDGDGCSKDCKIETGFNCTQPTLGDKMMVPVIYRDFRYHNPTEFEAGIIGQTTAVLGLVKNDLDSDGKPVYTGTGGNITSAADFAEWYRTSSVNHATASKLALWNNGQGAYVNRYGPNGEKWPTTIPAYFCGNVGNEVNGQPCTFVYGKTDCDTDLALGYTLLKCTASGGNYTATFVIAESDGNPLFFPVDDDLFTPLTERSFATIPPYYDPSATWPHDVDANGADRLHNFSFTSEVRYWFLYSKGNTYTLDFVGDDDVWVFINKKLAVDLGGVHTPVQGSVTLDATKASSLGLADGKVYEIAVFQTERQTTGSSYKLTLTGFNAAPSDCRPICGDGILEIGEECDDGVNAGGYGQCGPGCKLVAGYCGDGIVQPGEDCDDGVNNGNPCPSGCRIIIID
jgi:fibro-slime domain-containing protein